MAKMKKKIYFVSDIHANYDAFIDALEKVGYDEENENNLLVVLGDINDRGRDFLRLYKYLKELCDNGKAIVTSGNHHNFLIHFLKNDKEEYFDYHYNGLDETIADLWHRTKPFESWLLLNMMMNEEEMVEPSPYSVWQEICSKDINEEYPDLLPWLESMPRYFESEHYIGCHASLDLDADDWRKPNIPWDKLEFDDGSFICRQNNTNKTIVCGHFYTGALRSKWQIDSKNENDMSILKTSDNKVFIDGCSVLNNINIFVVEDEVEL